MSLLNKEAYKFVVEASTYEIKGMIPEAVYNYKRAVDEDDSSSFLRTRLALVLLKQGEIESATKQITKAIALDKNYTDAYSILGKVFLVKGDFEGAVKQFEKIIKIKPSKKRMPYLDICNVYLEVKKYDKAIGILKKLIVVNPSNAFAYYYLGRTYSEMNKLDKAKKNYKKVIDIKPLFVSPYKAVGLIEEFQGHYAEAIKYFKKALDIEIGNDNLRGHIAQIYIEMKEYESALIELKVLSENNQKNLSLKVKMGLVLLKLQKLNEAIVLFKKVVKKEPTSDRVLYYLGGAYFQKKKLKSALNVFFENPCKIRTISGCSIEHRLHLHATRKKRKKHRRYSKRR